MFRKTTGDLLYGPDETEGFSVGGIFREYQISGVPRRIFFHVKNSTPAVSLLGRMSTGGGGYFGTT